MSTTQRIELRLGALQVAFASASELRDALVDSLDEGRTFGKPWVRVGRDDSAPAWLWLGGLLRQRSDWCECAGLALGHAVEAGDDLTAKAFVDVLACDRQTVRLLDWTAPTAQTLGPIWGTRSTTGWGQEQGDHRPRLDRVIDDQRKFLGLMDDPTRTVLLETQTGGMSTRKLKNAASLRSLLEKTATKGTPYKSEWGVGPWAWLHEELVYRDWAADAIEAALPDLLDGGDAEVRAALDWLSDGHDLWRYDGLLEDLVDAQPDWWDDAAGDLPAGWTLPIKASRWSAVSTLGDVVGRLATMAEAQVATPPVVDLS